MAFPRVGRELEVTHMSDSGKITWHDLSVPDADGIRDFYSQVVGWRWSAEPMDGYSDYCMIGGGDDEVVAGICHARGENASIPPQWLLYINVPDARGSAAQAVALGGEIVHGPRSVGEGWMCVIRDPAGAVCALFQAGAGVEPE